MAAPALQARAGHGSGGHHGRITTFPGQSKYQIIVETLEPAGAGALMAMLEERRKKLAAEGLFDESRKKRLPVLPRVIAVVTSPTAR